MIRDDLEVFEWQEYHIPREIGRGCSSIVYAISKDLAIKIITPRSIIPPYSIRNPKLDINTNSFERLAREFEIQRQLYEGGISVPRPEGIFACTFPLFEHISFFKKYFPGLIMERLYGVKGTHALYGKSCTEDEKLTGMMEAEFDRAMALGFKKSIDACLDNTIYNPEIDKLWLIDFGGWSKIEDEREIK